MDISPNNVNCYVDLSAVYIEMKQYNDAVEAVLTGLEKIKNTEYVKDVDLGLLYYNLGVAYLNLEKFNNAETALLEAEKLHPEFDKILINLGVVYQRTSNLSEAVIMFKRSLPYTDTPQIVYYNLAVIEINRSNRDEALRYLDKALMEDPEFTPAIELKKRM